MKATILAAVAAGGAVGSVARFLVASLLQGPAWTGFPYGIFSVNVSGGFIMGVLTEALALKFQVSPETRAFLTTGVMGGYTTFSTFSLESALLIERNAYVSAGLYIAGSAVLSVVALFCGLWLVRGIYGH
jgi:CrcB protein